MKSIMHDFGNKYVFEYCIQFARQEARDGMKNAEEAITKRCTLATLSGHVGPVRTVAFAPSADHQLTCDRASHDQTRRDLSCDLPHQWVATGADDGLTKVWVAPSGRCLFTLKGHTGPVVAVKWSPATDKRSVMLLK